jgi:hypothetical protein
LKIEIKISYREKYTDEPKPPIVPIISARSANRKNRN